MTNLISIEVSLEALENKCRTHDWYYNYSDDNRVWSRGFDNYREINAILEKLGHSREAIEIHNTYAPERFKRPLESKYY
jgi:hypothetical protein